MIKVVIWTAVGRTALLEALAPLADVAVEVAHTSAEFFAALSAAQIIVITGTSDTYSAEVAARVRGARMLRWIHLMSAGYEGIVENGLPEHCVLTGPGEGVSTAVAEHALALLWALARGLPDAIRQQARQQWDRKYAAETLTLAGKTLLVAGFGAIGRKIGVIAQAIGMHVIGVSRSGRPHADAHEVHSFSNLLELLPRADAIVVALPLAATTLNLFDQHAFGHCRPGALFVNIGRGGTVDQRALLTALGEGTLRAAALDVMTPEPLPAGDALWNTERLLLTPHVGGAGDPQAIRRMAAQFAEDVVRFIRNEPLVNVVLQHDF